MADFESTECALCGSDNHKKLFSKGENGRDFTVVKCKGCGFIFMNPMVTPSGMKKIYTGDYYKTYNLNNPDKTNAAVLKSLDVSLFKKAVDITGISSGRILDIGCAMGFFLKSVKDACPEWEVFGCDVSAESVRYGNKKLGLRLRIGEVTQCNYPSKYFDVVTMREVIEHIKDPKKSLLEIRRILKDGGHVVIQTGNMESLVSKITGKKHFYYQIHHVSYFSLSTIKKFLELSGFDVVKITGINYIESDKLKVNGFKTGTWLKLLALNTLNKAKIGNFSVMGGMLVIAKKRST